MRREAADRFLALCDLMSRLRSPTGCPWDREQTVKTLRPYLLEEAHEVLDVLDHLDDDGGGPRAAEHCDELGDLLLQIVFQSEIQREHGRFDIGDVCDAIHAKLVRRHPHVFADDRGAHKGDAESWESIKRAERAKRGQQTKSALDGVPRHLPALLRALRTGEKARGAGFDWPSHEGVLAKIEEELGEAKQAIDDGDRAHLATEIGDLLYAVVNLARHFEIDPEAALRGTLHRYEERFRLVEAGLAAEGRAPEQVPLEELEQRWQQAKRVLEARQAARPASINLVADDETA